MLYSYVPGKCASSAVCGRRVVAVYSRLHLLKFAYVSSGSHDLAGQAFLFLVASFFSFFAPSISPVYFLIYLHDKEQKKEGLQRRLVK